MVTLYPEKLLNIITTDSVEELLVASFKKYGVSGYTILPARGEGSSGLESAATGFDANIMIKVILPESRMDGLLECFARKIEKGYQLTIFVSDVQVINPEKFNTTLR